MFVRGKIIPKLKERDFPRSESEWKQFANYFARIRWFLNEQFQNETRDRNVPHEQSFSRRIWHGCAFCFAFFFISFHACFSAVWLRCSHFLSTERQHGGKGRFHTKRPFTRFLRVEATSFRSISDRDLLPLSFKTFRRTDENSISKLYLYFTNTWWKCYFPLYPSAFKYRRHKLPQRYDRNYF